MKTYQVILTKSYVLTIKAKTAHKARLLSSFYTGDIQDISDSEDRRNEKFEIENIDCVLNEAYECIELSNAEKNN